jgi:hypothetical protein
VLFRLIILILLTCEETPRGRKSESITRHSVLRDCLNTPAGSRMQHMPLASGYRRSPVARHARRRVAAALSVAVVVILGHPPEVDLVDNVADTGETVLGNWSRADELVLFEGPSSWEVVVDHLAHLRA